MSQAPFFMSVIDPLAVKCHARKAECRGSSKRSPLRNIESRATVYFELAGVGSFAY